MTVHPGQQAAAAAPATGTSATPSHQGSGNDGPPVPGPVVLPSAGPAWQVPSQPASPKHDSATAVPAPPGPAGADEPVGGPGQKAAEWGWRGRANRLTGGTLTLTATREELVHRAARRRLLRSFSRTMSVVVANPKGGAAKTPTALIAAATLGFYRGGYTLAWDNNETRGTLGMRAEASTHQQTVVDLLHQIDDFLATTGSVGQLSAYLRPQSARFDVLASDDAAGSMEIIDDEAFRKLWTALCRFYRLIVIDTGNNIRAANWQSATAVADCLVVPTTVQRDVADSGLWMLDHLIRTGRADLAENAVAIVSCADPKPDMALLDDIVDRYRQVVRDVAVIPYDRLIRSGGRIEYDQLAVPTRRAWLMACSSIIDSLGIRDQD
ncbi:MinD-like ATPase involved in chromosome partitioning or flagellar assembly [Micromonospora pisi]|uniref:MinD-like ATPase involved in chromosome partitioning or flagellar assembly n=1 Tax=Micromonospora pisi TaxID=589240 RepID=A0A495JCI9_9ACTN|nr:cobalamin biosynthesis protein CobQ [Micromonospora pisi]RKR86726.1 MinD-like ATPase involved in chromosome partitioning or flagellar assembly [Micromonospora pisi]